MRTERLWCAETVWEFEKRLLNTFVDKKGNERLRLFVMENKNGMNRIEKKACKNKPHHSMFSECICSRNEFLKEKETSVFNYKNTNR